MATHSSVLAWRTPGTGSLAGCRLWGRTESDTTEVTAAAAAGNISCKDGLNKGQKWYGPNRNR